MKTRELLTQLDKLETGLDQFSFKELKATEAAKLKKSFEHFKNGLEAKVFGEEETEIDENFDFTKFNEKDIKLIANVSHEIKTPLNGILGFVDLLRETPLNPAQLEITNALVAASNGLMNTLNELLEFSKIASGNESFEVVSFNLNNVVQELLFLSKTLVIDKQITLKANIADDVPRNLVGDPAKLSQILMNLLGNAIKFVEEGSIALGVEVKTTSREAVMLTFNVADTGIGISEENLQRIFEWYQQGELDTQQKYGGSGLGLSIVKQLITKLGGTIRVESVLGEGTIFSFDLPFTQESTLSQNLAVVADKQIGFSLANKNILVIEDNSLNQKLFESQLQSWDANVALANNGVRGIQLLEEQQFDLVILDLRMPILNGFEVSEKIRKHTNAAIAAVPILAVSAAITENDDRKLKEAGINDFILKPYSAPQLVKTIKATLKDQHQRIQSQTYSEKQKTFIITNASDTIDLKPLYNECNKSIELLEELVRLFRVNVLEFIGRCKTHIQANNMQGIDFASHKIKSSLQMMNAKSLILISEQLSEVAKASKDVSTLNSLYNEFLNLFPEIDKQLEIELCKLKE